MPGDAVPIPAEQLDALRARGLGDIAFAAVPLPALLEALDVLAEVGKGHAGVSLLPELAASGDIGARAALVRQALDDSEFDPQSAAISHLPADRRCA